MKRNLFTILLTFISLAVSAQHLIKGKVIDGNNRPVISASAFVDLPDVLHQDTILLVRLNLQGKSSG